jgi:hypothetical protein
LSSAPSGCQNLSLLNILHHCLLGWPPGCHSRIIITVHTTYNSMPHWLLLFWGSISTISIRESSFITTEWPQSLSE